MFEKLVEAGGHKLHADPDVAGRDEAAQAYNDSGAVVGLDGWQLKFFMVHECCALKKKSYVLYIFSSPLVQRPCP